MMPAYMLMFAGAIGAITLIVAPEVAGKPLPGSGPSVDAPGEPEPCAGGDGGKGRAGTYPGAGAGAVPGTGGAG
jgi:MHS family proline/betaine transporter-like MFS transporter